MKQIWRSLILVFLLSTLACGGGGGGGGGGGTTAPTAPTNPGGGNPIGGGGAPPTGTNSPITYPNIKADPKYVGAKITLNGQQFTLTAENGRYVSFSYDSRNGYIYQFNAGIKDGGYRIYPLAMSNRDAIIIAARLNKPGEFGVPWLFGYDGEWSSSLPNGERVYYGYYQVKNPLGQMVGTYPVEVKIDFNSIQNSYGTDLNTGKDVRMTFSSLNGNSIAGSISDNLGDNNPASFGVFGTGGRTVVGGYAWELGTGIMLAEAPNS